MPVLLPFRAFRSPTPQLYIPGEEQPLPLAELVQADEPALYFYRQQFRFPGDREHSVRDGVMGILNRAEAVLHTHEETFPDRVANCARTIQEGHTDPGSMWLWSSFTMPPGLTHGASEQAVDAFGTLHQFWPITHPYTIAAVQSALAGKPLFLADGHHRFAAGWNLATIQVRTEALKTLPVHHLIPTVLALPETQPVQRLEEYLGDGNRCVAVTRGPLFQGFELDAAHKFLHADAITERVRSTDAAIAAVQSGRVPMALLYAPLSLSQIEHDAQRGILLPPKSTDFFPKLAAGLIMHRHQNVNTTPPTAQRPGVRNPSS